MKILYILPEYLPQSGGGIATYYAALLPSLVQAGHEVRVLFGSAIMSAPGGRISKSDGVETEILDSNLFAKYMLQFTRYQIAPKLQRHLAAAWALREQAEKGPTPDIVETTDWGLLFVPWMLRDGPPVVTTLHGSIGQIAHHDPLDGEQLADSIIQLIEILGLSSIEGVHTCSSNNVQFWEQKLGRKVDLVRPVFGSHGRPVAMAERTGRGLVVGRVQRWKGPHILCEAMQMLGENTPDIDWIGRDVPIHNQAGSTAHDLFQTWPDIWGRKIHHFPAESPEQIHFRQQAAGFVIVPSIWDVFNFTCIEAMTVGTPVVCSSAVGASDLIDNGITGYISAPARGRSLADNIESLLSLGPQQRAKMGAAGAETIRRALAADVVLPPRLDAYHAVSRQTRTPADEWLLHMCSPRETAASLDSSLNQVSLRRLLDHSLRRIWRKLSSNRATD